MTEQRGHRLAALTDEAAAGADDMHDVAAALRGHVAERGDDVDRLLEAFEYINREGDHRSAFIPAMQADELSYPAPLEQVADDTLTLWAEVVEHAEHPAVQARLSDLLFHRGHGNRRDRADVAATGYLELTGRWPAIHAAVELLPRALDLTRRVRLDERAGQVRRRAAALAEQHLRQADPKPGTPLGLLRLLVDDGWDDSIVDDLLEVARTALPSLWDTTSTIELQRRRAHDDDARSRLDRELVERHLHEAERTEGMRRAELLREAAELARDRGVSELRDEAIRQLQNLKADDLELKRITTKVSIPTAEIDKIIETYLDADGWADALERFAFLEIPTGRTDENREAVAEQQQEAPLTSMLPTTIYGTDGLPVHRAASDEEQFEFHLTRNEVFRLQFWAPLGVEALTQIRERFGSPRAAVLEGWLAESAHVTAGTARSIRRALKHFWAGEYEAAVAVGIPRLEAMARQIVLLADAPIYRIEQGKVPGQYPGLGRLLEILDELGMPESMVRYLSTTFTKVPGLNLRNEFAHGAVDDPGRGLATVVCQALLMMARLPIETHDTGNDADDPDA